MRCIRCGLPIPEPYIKATMCQAGPCRLQRAREGQQRHRAAVRAGVAEARVPKMKTPRRVVRPIEEKPLVLTPEECARIEATIAAELARIRLRPREEWER